ncbi:hypothetical protein NST21_22580 [Peribacillus sp. FSL K6-1552]
MMEQRLMDHLLKGEKIFIELQLTFSGEIRRNLLEHVFYKIQDQPH